MGEVVWGGIGWRGPCHGKEFGIRSRVRVRREPTAADPFRHRVEKFIQGLRVRDVAAWDHLSTEPCFDVSAQSVVHHPWVEGIALRVEDFAGR